VGPNYLNDTPNLVRWAGNMDGSRIRIPVSVNTPRVSGLSPTAAKLYVSGAKAGARAWATAMFQLTRVAIFDFDVRDNDPSAPITITVTDGASSQDEMAEGQAHRTYGTFNGQPVTAGARIELYRGGRSTLRVIEGFLENGKWSQWQFEAKIGEIVAHEMGHALAINGHSSGERDLMHRSGGEPQLDYATWISQADANTMMHAYCGRGQPTPAPPTSSASGTNVYAPFVGGWDCRSGAEGLHAFSIGESGRVSLVNRPTATVSGNQIQFEETGDGYFFQRRVFRFTLVGEQLRGTRTQYSRQGGSEVEQYTCTRTSR
jgi:hypothetical protein